MGRQRLLGDVVNTRLAREESEFLKRKLRLRKRQGLAHVFVFH